MMTATRTSVVEIALTIPDNEAYTALATLQRLGLDIAELRRAEVWSFILRDDVDDVAFLERIRTLETMYNPNKNELRVLAQGSPELGEVWIDEPGHGIMEEPVRISGRELQGVIRAVRLVSWRLFGRDGAPASPDVVDRASGMLLCNSAFQRARIR
jgi:hypothetical protein